MEGDNDLEAIYFNKEGDYDHETVADTEYFIRPDMVICENGIAGPKQSLLHMVGAQEQGSQRKVSIGTFNGVPHTNTRFSLIHNDIHSPIYAVGSCAEYPSFVQK